MSTRDIIANDIVGRARSNTGNLLGNESRTKTRDSEKAGEPISYESEFLRMTKTPKLQRNMGLHQRSINPTSRALKGQREGSTKLGGPAARTRAFYLTFGRFSVPC